MLPQGPRRHGDLRKGPARAAGEREPPCQRLVERDAEPEDVRRGRHGPGAALLGGHVWRGPHRSAQTSGSGATRDAEVEEHGAAAHDDDIGRLDVEVDEAPLVGVHQCGPEMDRHPHRIGHAEPASGTGADQRRQRRPVEEFHQQVRGPARAEAAHDVRVVEGDVKTLQAIGHQARACHTM